MNLYHLSQTVNADYDTYDSCIVAAETGADAATIHPNGERVTKDEFHDTWVPLSAIKVKLIGIADPSILRGVVCASFNAG